MVINIININNGFIYFITCSKMIVGHSNFGSACTTGVCRLNVEIPVAGGIWIYKRASSNRNIRTISRRNLYGILLGIRKGASLNH